MDGIDDFLKNNGVRIDRPLGRGKESMVFAVRSDDGSMPSVLKLQSLGAGRGFTLPVETPGVAGYFAKDRIGPSTLVALQPRAERVMDHDVRGKWGGIAEESRWMEMADKVQKSLAMRGLQWTDPHAGNVGVMPDGNMAAIDGAVIPIDEPASPEMLLNPEDAIRILRAR